MALSKTTIAVVLDQNFGPKLRQLAPHVPVWICSSETNSPVIKDIWEATRISSEKTDVTSFSRPDVGPEKAFCDDLDTIDLHHPFWLVLQVYGVTRTPQITDALKEYGVDSFQDNPNGFVAARPES